ncbi:MAG: alpha/beta hydrolase [Erythrobacter sp.]|nr:alpha/beta hydrolase [Erythrobacter sp.]NCQ62512.1 alpha/beta hydrolase [Alphaproteobacteria bacterium]
MSRVFLPPRVLLLCCVAGALAYAGPVASQVYEPTPLADTRVEFRGEAPGVIRTTTEDGLELEGAYWPPDEGVDQIVIVFHGNSYNHLVSAYRAEPLRIGGRGVLIASYRGYGNNPGKPSEDGLYRDAEAWIAKARALEPGARLYLFGFSLGGAVALQMAARDEFSGVATLGAFTRLRDMVPRLGRAFVKDRYDNLAAVPLVTEPLLLMHGTKDDVADPAFAERLEAVGGPNVIRINLTGGGHWVPLDSLAARIWQQWEQAGSAAPSQEPEPEGEPETP